jgi:hypothetical protein
MSEWYESQKNARNKFRKLLQERIENAKPRRNLTSDEAQRLTKLEAISDKIKR